MNQQQVQKQYNLEKLLLFPYGLFIITPVWWALFTSLYHFITDYDPLTWWGKLVIIAIGMIVIVVVMLVINYPQKVARDNKVRIYLLITPENWDLDKYIKVDLVEDMQECMSVDNMDWKIVVPNIYQRFHINM